MWILSFLPAGVFYAMIIIGFIGFTIGLLPILGKYSLPVQILSVLSLLTGVWYAGGSAKEFEYRKKIEEANARAKVAEEKAAAATAKVEYVFLDRIKTVKDVQVVVQERIKDVSVKIDENCKVVPDVISLHNQAARAIKKDAK